MATINTKPKMTAEEALQYLEFIENEIRVNYPRISIIIEIRIPFNPYYLVLMANDKVLHYSAGESFQNRVYRLKQWWENNQDILINYKRNG